MKKLIGIIESPTPPPITNKGGTKSSEEFIEALLNLIG